ncbi:Lengsin [Holothuria leucospilota]|uniref:Lengsin n=1 Tax=Holothuria leucospilota TaxID=206669 RepID=A0A9Q1C6C8_HOLLE|nr:Lengsin [Holothuria leucospilota]
MGDKSSVILEDCLKRIEELGIKHVRFEFYDLNFVARSKTFPSRHFRKFVNSGIEYPALLFAFDTKGNLVKAVDFIKRTYFSNMVAYPDLSTFAVLPWVKDTARVFISAPTVDDGGVLTIDPRSIALEQLKALEKRGMSLLSSFELEFTLLNGKTGTRVDEEMNCCSTLRLARHQEFFNMVSEHLYKAGVDIERVEAEGEKTVYELPTTPVFGIQSADMASTVRTGLKEMASQNGFTATFIAKPFEDSVVLAAHLNYSLWTLNGKTSLLNDSSRPFGLSEMGEHWIAGILYHIPALSALLSPTVNCRHPRKSEEFNPSNATWGIDNRTCAVRIKPRGPHGVYIEHRAISSTSNPYIGIAAIIAAGLDGIDRKLPLPKPVPTNKHAADETSVPAETKSIPKDIESALQCLTEDEVLRDVFGPDFINAFKTIKLHEKETLLLHCNEKCNDAFKWVREFFMEYI